MSGLCACAYSWNTSWLQKKTIAESKGLTFYGSKSESVWLWIIEYGIIKMTLFGGNSGKSKMPWLYPRNMNLNYFWICMNYTNISFETLPGCKHINSSNCQHAICVSLSSFSTLRTVQSVGLEGKGSLSLNSLFSSRLDCRRKLLFLSWETRFLHCSWWREGKGLFCVNYYWHKRRQWCQAGPRKGMRKKEWGAEGSSSLRKTKRR